MVLIVDKILVFKSGCMRGSPFDKPTECTTLEVINTRYIISVVKTQSISH